MTNWALWDQTPTPTRSKYVRREPTPPAEALTPQEIAAARASVLAASKASCARLRARLIESGHIVPLDARIAPDGTTRFRNAAGATVFKQGYLTAKMLAASHPAEREEDERRDKGRRVKRDDV